MATRYVFVLYDLYKQNADRINYQLVQRVDVDITGRDIQAVAEGLAPWALDVLRQQGLGLGLYSAEFATLDEDDEPQRYVYNVHICWNGSDEVVLLPDKRGILVGG